MRGSIPTDRSFLAAFFFFFVLLSPVAHKTKLRAPGIERGSTAWGVYLSVWQTSVAAFVDVGMPDNSSRQAAETEISEETPQRQGK